MKQNKETIIHKEMLQKYKNFLVRGKYKYKINNTIKDKEILDLMDLLDEND